MAPALASLLERISMLATERVNGTPRRLLERMEHTLTDGYAHALALEAEGFRLERQIAEAMSDLDAGGSAAGLGPLTTRLEKTRAEHRQLRLELDALKRRAEGVRRAA